MSRSVYIGVLGAAIAAAAVAVTLLVDTQPTEDQRQASTATAPLQKPPAEPAPAASREAEADKDAAPDKAAAAADDKGAAPAPAERPGTGGRTAAIGAPGATGAPAGQTAALPPPSEQEPREAPSFDVVRVNPTGDAVIAGRAQPDAEVVVTDGGRELGRSKADKHGDWVLLPNEPLAPGSHELALKSFDGPEADGGKVVESERRVIVVVPEAGKDIAGRSAGGAPGALALAVPREGTGGTTVLQTPGAEADEEGAAPAAPDVAPAAGPGAAGGKLSLDAIDYDAKGNVEISGRAPEGSEVQVYLDNKPVGAATADRTGVWRMVPPRSVPPGLYKLRVDQIDQRGKVVARIESPFSRAGPLEGLPSGVVVFVQPGNSLWRIARRTYGAGLRYTVIFEANREQIRDPDLIYPGQIFVLPRPANRAG